MNALLIIAIVIGSLLAIFGLVCLISFIRYAYQSGNEVSKKIRTNSKGEMED